MDDESKSFVTLMNAVSVLLNDLLTGIPCRCYFYPSKNIVVKTSLFLVFLTEKGRFEIGL